jgi:hypothetical protein
MAKNFNTRGSGHRIPTVNRIMTWAGLMFAIGLLPTPRICQGADQSSVFSKGTFTLETTASYGAGIDQHRQEELWSGKLGIGYFPIDDFSVNLSMSGYRVNQAGDNTWAGGGGLLLRYHFLKRDRFTFFLDGGCEVVESSRPVPDDGTHLNFLSRAGVGATMRITDDLHLLLGAHYFHFSNAGIDGSDRNPGINDGLEGYVGLLWTFR